MPLYMLQVLYPAKVAIQQLNKLLQDFSKGGSEGQFRIHWSSWAKLRYPQDEGGIRVRLLEDIANAFSYKLWWKFRTDKLLWAVFMR